MLQQTLDGIRERGLHERKRTTLYAVLLVLAIVAVIAAIATGYA